MSKELDKDSESKTESEGEVFNDSLPSKPVPRYEFSTTANIPPEEEDPVLETRSRDDSTVSNSQRSRGSMYSAFSLD